jgi:hypothetical protein
MSVACILFNRFCSWLGLGTSLWLLPRHLHAASIRRALDAWEGQAAGRLRFGFDAGVSPLEELKDTFAAGAGSTDEIFTAL